MMNCFPCFQSQKSKKGNRNTAEHSLLPADEPKAAGTETKKQRQPPSPAVADAAPTPHPAIQKNEETKDINAQSFTFRELAAATKNFRQECLLGEGGFGRVYKGTLQSNGQVVAVKQLDRNGTQGSKEFLVEVLMLSLLHHPNLVNLIGYCADGDQRLLVYEFLSGGSVGNHLLDATDTKSPLDWTTRMKIAFGAAQGLEYLHDKANPPVLYRDLKSSNILLDANLEPKLSDFSLAKLGPQSDKMGLTSRVMGTYGHCAPECASSGEVTVKSDVYSFGVILLELITGRRVIDTTRPVNEQNLISWARPIFRDPKRFPDMADPLLRKRFPEKGLNEAVAIASMCLQEEAGTRPLMSDVVTALSFLSSSSEPIPDASQSDEDDDDDDDDDECSGSENGSEYDDGEDSNGSSHSKGSSSDDEESKDECDGSVRESENSGSKRRSAEKMASRKKSSKAKEEKSSRSKSLSAVHKKKSTKLSASSTRKNSKKLGG